MVQNITIFNIIDEGKDNKGHRNVTIFDIKDEGRDNK